MGEVGVIATIPEGATYVNIGVEILQPDNDQHGSVYFDDFVAAPYNPAVVEESVTPVAVSDLGRKRKLILSKIKEGQCCYLINIFKRIAIEI